jgi:hypothetical protein
MNETQYVYNNNVGESSEKSFSILFLFIPAHIVLYISSTLLIYDVIYHKFSITAF